MITTTSWLLPYGRGVPIEVYKPKIVGREGAIPHPLNNLHQPSPDAHSHFTPLLYTPCSLELIPMSYSYSNNNFYSRPTTFVPEDFAPHQYLDSTSSTGAANQFRMDNAFTNGWGRIDRPAPIVGPSMSNPVPTTYGDSHGHNLADRCLTRSLQIPPLQTNTYSPTPTATPNRHTPVNTTWSHSFHHTIVNTSICRMFKTNLRRRWKRMLSPRPLVAVSTFSTLKNEDAH